MEKGELERKKFLEQQLEWCKEQDYILEEIEMKLYEMKRIAEYAFSHELIPLEIHQMNDQLKELKSEVRLLEKQLFSIVH
ncbi:hypothetical protein [Priestia megaterium]|jgi:hypothetical protein|uniref:hypothetical protein n=1 Tax=Priestia megaterium TaxID=1404 RepID=UPI001C21A154|nr:hypothetical protein [Priestia megaterium]MBU8752298.1 hypothetical protein [Priestia megaterium]